MGDLKPLASLLGIRGRGGSGEISSGGVGIGAGTGAGSIDANGADMVAWSCVGGGPTACATETGAGARGCDSDPPLTALADR